MINRRNMIKTAGALAAASTLPAAVGAAPVSPSVYRFCVRSTGSDKGWILIKAGDAISAEYAGNKAKLIEVKDDWSLFQHTAQNGETAEISVKPGDETDTIIVRYIS